MRVGEDLNLDVPWTFDEPLDVQRAVAECCLGLTARALDGVGHLAGAADDFHADAAATRRGLEEDGKTDRRSRGGERRVGLIRRRLARDDGDAGRLHQRSRANLGAHALDGFGRRSDERQAGLGARARKVRALRQKAVAGMNGVCAGSPSRIEQRGNVQVALRRRGRANRLRTIRSQHMRCPAIRLRKDRDGFDPHLAAGAHDPDSDLTAVGDEQPPHHLHLCCRRVITISKPTQACSWRGTP